MGKDFVRNTERVRLEGRDGQVKVIQEGEAVMRDRKLC